MGISDKMSLLVKHLLSFSLDIPSKRSMVLSVSSQYLFPGPDLFSGTRLSRKPTLSEDRRSASGNKEYDMTEAAVTTRKVTLFYWDGDDEVLGRALTPEEYENISLNDLQVAILNSIFLCEIDCGEDKETFKRNDDRAIRAFYELSTDQLNQRLKDNEFIILRCNEPLWRNVFPPITRGPRKGMPNYKKQPDIYMDRIYRVAYETNLMKREGHIEEDEDGYFTVLEAAA
jgi:hypothetical protein